ncbi:MAG: hypothetical protein R3F30_06215 [Planctomycetota bacterium]
MPTAHEAGSCRPAAGLCRPPLSRGRSILSALLFPLLAFSITSGSGRAEPVEVVLAPGASAASGDFTAPDPLDGLAEAAEPSLRGDIHRRVIHLWVDPHYGVDSDPGGGNGAIQLNPACSNGCAGSGECQPIDVFLSSTCIPLLNDPWPFKTISAAVASVPALPVAQTCGTHQYVWKYAIVHLMPGLYAREYAYDVTQTTAKPNPHNGLLPNGESFPIDIPDYVSIQGTSALDTIVDLGPANHGDGEGGYFGYGGGPAFRFGNSSGSTGEGSFIDSVAIMGAYPYDSEEQNPAVGSRDPEKCSGIHIDNEVDSAPTISNCFLFGNGIGILIEGVDDPNEEIAPVSHDGTRIIGNTIAMNYIGLWNGERYTGISSSSGISKLILLNNVFDASPDQGISYPTNWLWTAPFANFAPQGFEGVDASDLAISGSPPVDYNAYEASKYNSGNAHPFVGTIATAVRSSSPSSPRIDIAPITGGTSAAAYVHRGTLYVRDLIENGAFHASSDFDRSPHDFRLSPAVAPFTTSDSSRPDALAPGSAYGALNPLVNTGWAGSFTLTMANGEQLTAPPGYLDLDDEESQNIWPYTAWYHDCEGFGNDRIQDHDTTNLYPSAPGGQFPIDIGADELGERIAAGYRHGTRSLLNLTGLATSGGRLPPYIYDMDNKYLWFLGIPAGYWPQNYTPVSLRPSYRQQDHQGSPPADYENTPGSGTYWVPWFDTWTWSASGYYNPKIADITPHLLPDIHPWWSLAGAPSNPIWQDCNGSFNVGLYTNPSSGIINPPGTYMGDQGGTPGFRWLDGTWAVSPTTPNSLINMFGGANLSFRDGSDHLYLVDTWCRLYNASSPLYDTLLPTFHATGVTTYTALRYALEDRGVTPWSQAACTDASNLQTFMVIVQGEPD